MIEIPYLKDFIQSLKKAATDDFADRLSYYYTAAILTFFALLVGAKQSFGRPIECMMPQEYPDPWKDYVREFCYVSSTYFVPIDNNTTVAQLDQYRAHGYYQWVPFILIIMAILMYLPSVFWKGLQRRQSVDFQHVVTKAQALRFSTSEEHQKGVKDIAAYLKSRMQHQGSTRGYSISGFGMKASLLHIAAKMLSILVILSELYFINYIFGDGQHLLWGIAMLGQGLTNTRWKGTGVFPRLTFCDFHQPILGGNFPRRSVQCVLMANMINEKIFIFVWLWLAAVLIISIIDLFVTFATLFLPFLRDRTIRTIVQTPPASASYSFLTSSSSYKSDDGLDVAARIFGVDGVHLFNFIKLNAGSLVAADIANAFLNDEKEEEVPKPPVHKEAIALAMTTDGAVHEVPVRVRMTN